VEPQRSTLLELSLYFRVHCQTVAASAKSVGRLRKKELRLTHFPPVKPRGGSARTTEEQTMKILMVLTFHDQLGNTGRKTWAPFSIIDGRVVSGQNPASSTSAARDLLSVLAAEKAA
jgi:putative intracellular protease/amidase